MNLRPRAEHALELLRLCRDPRGKSPRAVLARLFGEQFDIIARRQADQPNAVGQILSHFDRAGADRPGAPEKNDFLHQRK